MTRKNLTVLCLLIAAVGIGSIQFARCEKSVKNDVATFVSQFNNSYADDAQIIQEVTAYTRTKFGNSVNTISAVVTLDFSTAIWKSYASHTKSIINDKKAARAFLQEPTLTLFDYETYFFVGIVLIILGLVVLYFSYVLYGKYKEVEGEW